jgi:molybdopterin-containing oxidoreductase family iron-sulfur binding subunit
MERRNFVKAGALISAGAAGAYVLPLVTAFKSRAGGETAGKRRWGMVVDLTKCRADCTACVEACRKENNVAFHGDPRWDVHRIRKVTLASTLAAGKAEKPMLLLCNHCDEPPCVTVCPIQATYRRADGIVIVDPHRCMGCRYCVVACPYNARHFNFRENPSQPNPKQPKRSHGVAESCTLCAHLLDRGERPACVTACERAGARALAVGNLNDPDSDVSRIIRTQSVKRLREELGTQPKVFYVGL